MSPALLDVLGRPVLARLFDSLAGHGVTQAMIASAPEQAMALRKACGTGAGRGLARMAGIHAFHAPTRGSAAESLVALQQAHGAIDTETVVITGPCVTDMDLAALVTHHRAAGAEATLAMAAGPDGTALPSGIAILTPAAVSALAGRGLRRRPHAADLFAALTEAGVRIATWTTSARAFAPTTPQAYMALLTAMLEDRMPGHAPVGDRTGQGLWVAPGADLGRRVEIEGRCWIGPAARIEAGASLKGPSVVGAGARVAKGSYLRNAMLWAGAEMLPGAWVDGVIAASDWAVSHRAATDPAQADMPLDQIAGAPTLPAMRPATLGGPLVQSA